LERKHTENQKTLDAGNQGTLDAGNQGTLDAGNQGTLDAGNQGTLDSGNQGTIDAVDKCGEGDIDESTNFEDSNECMFNPLIENQASISEHLVTESANLHITKSANENNVKLSPQQQRKNSLLLQAQQFAELKKRDSNVLPFNLHVHLKERESSEKSSQSGEVSMSEIMSPVDLNLSSGSSVKDNQSCGVREVFSHSNAQKTSNSKASDSKGDNSGCENICDTKGDNSSSGIKEGVCVKKGNNPVETMGENCVSSTKNCDIERDNSEDDKEEFDAFDVYNIETALPELDWKNLEEKLKAANEEAKRIQEVSFYTTFICRGKLNGSQITNRTFWLHSTSLCCYVHKCQK